MPTRQSGNMFVYILGAIFLLGILIILVKGSFQEGSGIDGEKAVLKVSEIQRYGSELERGVSYILRNGKSESDIRFAHPSALVAYGLITDVPARQVFDPTGGGVEWRSPPTGIQTVATPWYFSAYSMIDGVGSTCVSPSCAELTAYLPNVTKAFCMAVNTANGITNPSGDAPVDPDSFSWNTAYVGTFSNGGTIDTTGGHTFGKMEGCVKDATLYYYYRVLLAR